MMSLTWMATATAAEVGRLSPGLFWFTIPGPFTALTLIRFAMIKIF
jgi:hypothetical protein